MELKEPRVYEFMKVNVGQCTDRAVEARSDADMPVGVAASDEYGA
jgi:hypothetical protein